MALKTTLRLLCGIVDPPSISSEEEWMDAAAQFGLYPTDTVRRTPVIDGGWDVELRTGERFYILPDDGGDPVLEDTFSWMKCPITQEC